MGNCLTPTKVNLEYQVVEYSSGKISNQAEIKFIGPEFDKVFDVIYQKHNIEEYYYLRQLSKFHHSRFENQFKSTFIEYEDFLSYVNLQIFDRVKDSKVIVQYKNLRSLAESEYSHMIKYLTVPVAVKDQDINNYGDLRFISTKYFRNIKLVNVNFKNREAPRYPPHEFVNIKISLNESFIFRRVNFTFQGRETPYLKLLTMEINCDDNHNIKILKCNFDSVALRLERAKKVTILNSAFKNVCLGYALKISNIKRQLIIENIEFLNCDNGMEIYKCENPIINKLKIQNFHKEGCCFSNVKGARLSNASIVGDEIGIYFYESFNAKISDCTIKDCTRCGILVLNKCVVKYKGIYFERTQTSQNNQRDFEVDKLSVLTRIL